MCGQENEKKPRLGKLLCLYNSDAVCNVRYWIGGTARARGRLSDCENTSSSYYHYIIYFYEWLKKGKIIAVVENVFIFFYHHHYYYYHYSVWMKRNPLVIHQTNPRDFPSQVTTATTTTRTTTTTSVCVFIRVAPYIPFACVYNNSRECVVHAHKPENTRI